MLLSLIHICYENCQTVSDKLTWSHICELIKIDDELERSFYEKECYKEKWDVRTLRRQMESALFLRLATSRDKEGILALAREGITCLLYTSLDFHRKSKKRSNHKGVDS